MPVFQLAYLSRYNDRVGGDHEPMICPAGTTGMLIYKAPCIFHLMEGDAADLCCAYGAVCRAPAHDVVHCVLFRPVANRMFSGFETKVIDSKRDEDDPRAIDLWAALNLETPRDDAEAMRQVEAAFAWFVGASIGPMSDAAEFSMLDSGNPAFQPV